MDSSLAYVNFIYSHKKGILMGISLDLDHSYNTVITLTGLN